MTGKIKLVHSGGNSVSIAVPTSAPSASEVEFKLPQSDGSANEVLKTDGSGNLSFGADAGGKFLQIVGAVDGSNVSFNSTTTYADTGMSINITTSASGHAGVFAMVSGNLGGVSNTSGGESVAIMRLMRDTTELIYANHGGWAGNVSGQRTQDYSNAAMNFYDTGTSASTTYTYKVQFKKHSDSDNAVWNQYNGKSTIYLIEVGT